MKKKKSKRILVKITGEGLSGVGKTGLNVRHIQTLARKLIKSSKFGIEIAIVVGGGNILRGTNLSDCNFIRMFAAHQMGMVATVINGIALQEALISAGNNAELLCAFNVGSMVKQYDPRLADKALTEGKIVILAGGTGNPFVTTDTCAAIRSAELEVDLFAKATKVDGVYSEDPIKKPLAKRFDKITYDEFINRRLEVIDISAVRLCQENNIPIAVFNYEKLDKLNDIVKGKIRRTLITK